MNKDLIDSPRKLWRQLKKSEDRLHELCSVSPRAIRYDATGGTHSGFTGDPVGDMAIKIMEEQEHHSALACEYMRAVDALDQWLELLLDEGKLTLLEQSVLFDRLILNKTAAQTARETGKSLQYIYDTLSRAQKKIRQYQDEQTARDPPDGDPPPEIFHGFRKTRTGAGLKFYRTIKRRTPLFEGKQTFYRKMRFNHGLYQNLWRQGTEDHGSGSERA